MDEEAGINFAPKILRRSQSLSRGVNDLMNWDKAKEMKKDLKKEQQDLLSSRQLKTMCPGSKALLDNIGYTHQLQDLNYKRQQDLLYHTIRSRRNKINDIQNLTCKKKQTLKITKLGKKAQSVVRSLINGKPQNQRDNNRAEQFGYFKKPPLPRKPGPQNYKKLRIQTTQSCTNLISCPQSARNLSQRDHQLQAGLHNISKISHQTESQQKLIYTPTSKKKIIRASITNSAPHLDSTQIPQKFKLTSSCHRNCIPQIYNSNLRKSTQKLQQNLSLKAKSKAVRERLNQYYQDKREQVNQYEFNGCKFQSQETISEHQGSEEVQSLNQIVKTTPVQVQEEVKSSIKFPDGLQTESFQHSQISKDPSSARVANITPSKMFEMPSAFANFNPSSSQRSVRSTKGLNQLSEAIVQSLQDPRVESSKQPQYRSASGMEVVSQENTTAGYSMTQDQFMEQMATFNYKIENLIKQPKIHEQSSNQDTEQRYMHEEAESPREISLQQPGEESPYNLNQEEKAELLRRISMFQRQAQSLEQ